MYVLFIIVLFPNKILIDSQNVRTGGAFEHGFSSSIPCFTDGETKAQSNWMPLDLYFTISSLSHHPPPCI